MISELVTSTPQRSRHSIVYVYNLFLLPVSEPRGIHASLPVRSPPILHTNTKRKSKERTCQPTPRFQEKTMDHHARWFISAANVFSIFSNFSSLSLASCLSRLISALKSSLSVSSSAGKPLIGLKPLVPVLLLRFPNGEPNPDPGVSATSSSSMLPALVVVVGSCAGLSGWTLLSTLCTRRRCSLRFSLRVKPCPE